MFPLLVATVFVLATAHQPTVYTKLGEVTGFQVATEIGGIADIFLGIPFSQPPVGELRFEVNILILDILRKKYFA